ncbi:MAG TPA: flagellar motor protein MotB, partial [Planctomycetaceae bacterium]|nr:flagellar motor protein MotB [Planctomycetaceae bacterium]
MRGLGSALPCSRQTVLRGTWATFSGGIEKKPPPPPMPPMPPPPIPPPPMPPM